MTTPTTTRMRFGSRPLRGAWHLGVLVVACVTAYYLTVILGSGSSGYPSASALTAMGAKVDLLIADGQLYRFVTSIPLHGSTAHLVINMAWLVLFGLGVVIVARGSIASTVFWLSGVFGQLCSYLVEIGDNIGASGAIFGLAAYGAAAAWRLAEPLEPGIRARLRLCLVVLSVGVLVGPFAFDGVDHAAHFGGAGAGFGLAFVGRERLHAMTAYTLGAVLLAYLWWAVATAIG